MLGGGSHLKNFMDGLPETVKVVVYQPYRANNRTDGYHYQDAQSKRSHCEFSLLTFALKAFFSQDADKGQELGDLFQIQHSGVVEFDDGHGLFVIGTAATILPQPEAQRTTVA